MNSEMTFSYFSQTCTVSPVYVSITTRVMVGQSSLHRLAILRIAVLLPGIFLMIDVGLGEIYGVPPGEPKLCSVG